MAKPPLALSAVAIAADGTETTWWSGDRFAYNRPQALNFRTRIGEGFSDGGATLPRRIDRDYNDLELYNDLVFVGDDGQIAYEGRIGATPRSTQGGHSIAVQSTGWMAHAKDRKFREIYVDRDVTQWQQPSLNRQVTIANANVSQNEIAGQADNGALVWNLPASQVVNPALGELWYAMPSGLSAAIFTYLGGRKGMAASWEAPTLYSYDNDQGLAGNTNGLSLDGALRTVVLTQARRYLSVRAATTATVTPGGGDQQRFEKVAVYGDHGLTAGSITGEPGGFYASDVISDIAQRFCPKLNTAGVQGTTLSIPHIVFRDRTTPFDAFLLLNGPHGYELAVWEGKTLTFRPYDLSDYDWQVRMDQPGVDLSLQGDTTEGLANYAVVEFDNVATGQRDQVSPADDASLEDTTVDHPANTHGLDVELTVGLTFATTKAVAIAFGRSYLNEFNRPKNRGQITVQGHILDASGHWIQPWMVRAGQTISVVDHPNDTPRLITETAYDHPTRTVTISTDSGELNMVEAVVDYIKTSLQASNL